MENDFWGFKDSKDLDKKIEGLPDTILKKQFSILSQKTNYVLYGKSVSVKANDNMTGYQMANVYKVVVPSLDNYEKILLILYSNPEEEYPVAITVNKGMEIKDNIIFEPDYVCENKDQLIEAVKKILSSDEITNVIKILYAKASVQEVFG